MSRTAARAVAGLSPYRVARGERELLSTISGDKKKKNSIIQTVPKPDTFLPKAVPS